jgi:hypothetical protein
MAPDERALTVPLHRVVPEEDMVEAPVCVGGRGPFAFIIDTGSSGTLFTTHLAGRLGLAPSGPSLHFGGAGCVGETRPIRMPALSVGGHLRAGGGAFTIHATGFGGPGQPQGVLGVDTLSELGPLLLDYRRLTLSIAPPAMDEDDLPPAWLKHEPQVRAPLALINRGGGVTLRVIVGLGERSPQAWLPDTGSFFSLIDAENAKNLRLRRVPGDVTQPSSCSNKMLHSHRVWSGNWRLADRSLRPQALQVTAVQGTVGVEGVVGAKTMAEYGSVIFDWGARQLLLGID